jgi:hypothetical protein
MACVEAVVSRRSGGLGNVQLDKDATFTPTFSSVLCRTLGCALQDDIDRWMDMNPYCTASKDVVVGYQIPHATLDDVRRM